MLIHCPRCGFEQPKDQYCAQCGVDIENYKPVKPTLIKVFIKNPLTHLTLIVLFSGLIGLHFYQKNLTARLVKMDRSTSTNEASKASAHADAKTGSNLPPTAQADSFIDNKGDRGEELSSRTDGSINAHKIAATTGGTVAQSGQDEKNREIRSANKQQSTNLIVYYAEVSRSSLGSIFNSSRSTGQFMEFADYSAGIIPNIDKAISSPQIKILHKEIRPLEVGKTLQWFYGTKDQRDHLSDIGIGTIFEVNDTDNANLRGNLEIQRFWRESNATGGYEIQKKSFPAIVEIGGETGFFLSGIMPRRTYLEDDQEILSLDIFKILQSPAFKAGESSFVIFIEFENIN